MMVQQKLCFNLLCLFLCLTYMGVLYGSGPTELAPHLTEPSVAIRLRYATGTPHNAEALLVHDNVCNPH